MAGKVPGSSEQSLTILQRTARLYEGECWWLSNQQGDVRGLFLFDGGKDLISLRQDVLSLVEEGGRLTCERQGAARVETQIARSRASHSDCQVTVEERTQLFSPFRGNG